MPVANVQRGASKATAGMYNPNATIRPAVRPATTTAPATGGTRLPQQAALSSPSGVSAYGGGPMESYSSSSSSGSAGLGSAISGLLGQATTPQGPAASYSPSTFTSSAGQNPQLAALQQDAATMQSQLAGNTDLEATQAMQRERDATSGMAKEFGADLASRGILGSGAGVQDLQNRIIEPGAQRMTQANVALTNAGRDKQMAALSQRQGLTQDQIAQQQAQQQFGLSAWQAAEQQKLAGAQLQAMQRNQGVQNLSSIIGLLGNIYSGF